MSNPIRTPHPKHCKARTRSGRECGRWPMVGQLVCDMHGGKSPQALRKADERMRDLVDPAISGLERRINSGEFDAMKYVLDWAGFKPAVQAQVDQQVTIRVVDEAQPIVIEHGYELNGRTDH